VSQLKSLAYSIFVSRRRKYRPESYGADYFKEKARVGDSSADLARCRAWVEYCKPTNALDVGFGTGSVLRGLLELGVDASGVEPFLVPQELLSDDLKKRVRLGSVVSTGFPDRSVDLVTCLDVLEHIPCEDTDAALRELVRVSRRWVLLNICYWTDSNARKDRTHINLHSAGWWRKHIEKSGARIIAHPREWPHPRSTVLLKVD